MTGRLSLAVFASLSLAVSVAKSEQVYTKEQFLQEYTPAYERMSSYAGQIRGFAEISRTWPSGRRSVSDYQSVRFWVDGANKRLDVVSHILPPGVENNQETRTTVTNGQGYFGVEKPKNAGRYPYFPRVPR